MAKVNDISARTSQVLLKVNIVRTDPIMHNANIYLFDRISSNFSYLMTSGALKSFSQ